MPKAIDPPITPARDVATPAPAFDIAAWIERMNTAPDAPCVAAAEHPDNKLLALAERALVLMREEQTLYQANPEKNLEALRDYAAQLRNIGVDIRTVLRRASNMRASTPAGLFAKVQLVARSKTGAAILAKSLAADMIEMPGLRRLLWPAQVI